MVNRITLFSLSLLLLGLAGCSKSYKRTATYFGGKITNPKSDNVILYSMDKAIDTFFIDKNNKFIGALNDIEEGLFYFVHGNENQYIYLEPLDSLVLSLNTWEFDESLVFSGDGAERNNILIDCFLQFEKDKKLFYNYNGLTSKDFKNKVDSLITLKQNTYLEYAENHPNETDNFKNILKVALTFPIYSRIESYPNSHAKKMNINEFPKTPNSFYNFREDIDRNDESLMYYSPYTNYINKYLYNITYAKGHKPMQQKFSSEFTVDLLKTIDDNIDSEISKNAFLKQTLVSHFYSKSTCEVNTEEFEVFFELSSNEEDKNIIRKLLEDNSVVHTNHEISNFTIKDFNNTNQQIHSIIKDKNSFLLFWNPEYISKQYIRSRINFLETRYPKIQFLTFRIDGNKNDIIEKLNIKNQFYIDSSSDANKFLTSKMTRTILINKDGIVTNGYASISSKNVYPALETLSKY